MFNSDQMSSLVRSLFKIFGAALAVHGYATAAGLFNSETIIGAVAVILATVFSHLIHGSDPAGWNDTPNKPPGALCLLILILALGGMTATAQTNAPTAPALNATNIVNLLPASSGVTHNLGLAALDLYADIKAAQPFTTNGNATARAFGGANTSDKKLIFGLMVTVPVTDKIAIGALVAHRGSQWYEGGANLSYGVTNTLPIIGACREFAGDGLVYNFTTREPANYTFAGIARDWVISSKWSAGAALITANTSDESGVDVLLGLHATYTW